MDVSGIGRSLQLPGTIDNGDLTATKAHELDPQKEISGGEKTTPSVIRHTSDAPPPSSGLENGGITEMYRQVSLLGREWTPDEILQRKLEAFDIFLRDLGSAAADMRQDLDKLWKTVRRASRFGCCNVGVFC